ncbi:MAG TPA: hypothetical protein VLT81_11645 [Chondromyces sp.]|nr:hypothetical protein [Chondromyces sp.]
MTDDELEIAYFREIEDLFAALRGVPHILSPKDFHLMRSWWDDGIPLSAVRTGVAEVFAHRRERGDDGPVVSLTYCRHAVRKHAKRLAEMRVGAADPSPESRADTDAALGSLAQRLADCAATARPERPRVAAVIESIAAELRADLELTRARLEEHLFALESSLLANCLEALADDEREHLEQRARTEAEAIAAEPEARERTFKALRDRLVRELVGLPRLELEP